MDHTGIITTAHLLGPETLGPSMELCNYTVDYCSEGMKQPETGTYTAIALVRMVTSVLSILGTASIIVSVIVKRQVKSSKVHPIFVLSIADFMLAVLWVVGGALWLTRVNSHRVWCFMATLTTAILECVAINLTFVYALYAHAHITHMNLGSLISNHLNPSHGWSRLKVALVYITAWLLPTVLVMAPFGFVAGFTNILPNANRCSCGCVPKFLNVLPFPANSKMSQPYMLDILRLDLSLSVVIALHYMVIFPLLVFYYYRVLKHIRRIRRDHEGNTSSMLYGATEAVIVRGHSQAKHRVFLFLTVFVVTGLCNLVLAWLITVFISVHLADGDNSSQSGSHHSKSTMLTTLTTTTIIQSITVPLQGFLNAIVYGWTREDFLYVMAATGQRRALKEQPPQINDIATVYDNDLLSDLETSCGESDAEVANNYRRTRQQTPETVLSGNW